MRFYCFDLLVLMYIFCCQVGPITFQTKFQPHLVWTLDQVGFIIIIISASSNANSEYAYLDC